MGSAAGALPQGLTGTGPATLLLTRPAPPRPRLPPPGPAPRRSPWTELGPRPAVPRSVFPGIPSRHRGQILVPSRPRPRQKPWPPGLLVAATCGIRLQPSGRALPGPRVPGLSWRPGTREQHKPCRACTLLGETQAHHTVTQHKCVVMETSCGLRIGEGFSADLEKLTR